MGMHEYEDLVENSVILLSKSDLTNRRDFFASLYAFQARYDTGYSHFRVIDHLIEARFVYKFSMEDHPDFDKYASSLDKLKNQESGFIYLDPTKKWSEENEPVGYWKAPFLYFDAGSKPFCFNDFSPDCRDRPLQSWLSMG